MKVAIFLQARLGSTRLPQKIIKPLGGKTFIEQVVDRLKGANNYIQQIIIVTSYQSESTLSKIFSNDPFVSVFAGSEEDVLERYYKANHYFNNDIIIRATADNPFVSIDYLIFCLKVHIKRSADLTYCKGLPLGSGVEIISSTALDICYFEAYKSSHLEHVTPYIYENKDRFDVVELTASGIYHRPDIRLTVDVDEDFQVAEIIFEKLYKDKNNFYISDIIKLWDNESLFSINENVKQRSVLV